MDESADDSKFMKKFKENPAFPIGLAALAGIVGYRLFNLKKRDRMLSLYLIELRLVAQGSLLACVVLGAGYKMYQDLMTPKEEKIKKQ